MLEKLKEEVLQANKMLQSSGLVKMTWGNVSGLDEGSQLVVIKPSGVEYDKLRTIDLVVVDLQGHIVEGELNPSSDTPTHLELYREFPMIRGITHTHSLYATSLCQMGQSLPCLGTTHADHFFGTVPLVRPLSEAEVNEAYELNTGKVIVETFRQLGLDPVKIPAVLQHFHAPFTWGSSPLEAVNNSIALEFCAQMALHGLQARTMDEMPLYLQRKHYLRKHGEKATYGQRNGA